MTRLLITCLALFACTTAVACEDAGPDDDDTDTISTGADSEDEPGPDSEGLGTLAPADDSTTGDDPTAGDGGNVSDSAGTLAPPRLVEDEE